MRSVQDDVEAVGRMPAVPTILDVMARVTGMRFTAVARVTDETWTACAVHDEIAFGLRPGGTLELGTTICNEIRQHGQKVVFGSASGHPHFSTHPTPKLYGFESYISIPVVRADGSFFGTLCAIDPLPAKLDGLDVIPTLELFAQLIAAHLDTQDLSDRRAEALAAAAETTRQLEHENRRIAALMSERQQAEEAVKRELEDTRLLRDVASRLIGVDGSSVLFGEILDAALEIVRADAGTIQLLDPATQTLGFLATRGFKDDILGHFSRVDASSGSPCGVALASGQRAIVSFGDAGTPDPDGSLRWHRDAGVACAQSTPLVSRSGRPLGMFSTHWSAPRDLSERELRFLDLLGRQAADLIERNQAHEALQASERHSREEARRKDEFIAVLAHELRNPLAPIRSGVQILRHAGQEPQLVEQVRPMMERQVGHMVRLIDDLLDVSRISSGKVQLRRETVSLQSLIDTAVEANRGAIAAAGIELQVQLDQPGRTLNVDPTRLSQVVSNVLHNAAKFTPAAGRIMVDTAFDEVPGGESAQVIRISDTGVGIPTALLPTIFELFTQVRPESAGQQGGMGIGLALSRSLAELHGGTLTAHSAGQGQGSEFTLRIPVMAMPAANGIAARDAEADADLAGLRVLVIDDNQDAADSIGLLLSHCGGDVRVDYDALRVLDTVRDFQPTLVLLDIGLPGIDGYEACRLVRRREGADIHIVALTGWGQDEDRRRAAEAGFDAHLTKPVDFSQLIRIAVQARSAQVPREVGGREIQGN